MWIVRNLYQNVFKQTVRATMIILKGDKQETLKIFNMKQEHLEFSVQLLHLYGVLLSLTRILPFGDLN